MSQQQMQMSGMTPQMQSQQKEMMMRRPGPGGMQGMQRGQPGMGGPMMMQGMRPGMMPGHPMHQGMGSRPPPPEYGMSSQGYMMNPNMRMPGGMGPGGPMGSGGAMGPGGAMPGGPGGAMGPGPGGAME